nr:hypothetical protein [Streptomyces sp. S1D4-11]QIZ00821.1 hypothetical protein HEP87_52835 [Streptomyces sp. S1D4-11]
MDTALLRARLPHSPKAWPAQLRQIAGEAVTKRAPQTLLAGLAATVFPREIDLQAFRVLLLLAVDACTPEELLDLGTGDVEFTDGEVRPRQTKNRAACTRHRLHTGVPAIPDGGMTRGEGRWDVPGLLRRLISVTASVRRAYPGLAEWLWVAVEPAGTGCARVAGRRAGFVLDGRRSPPLASTSVIGAPASRPARRRPGAARCTESRMTSITR